MNVSQRLGKGPDVSGKVFCVVLALAEWVSRRLLRDDRAVIAGCFAVGVDIVDTDQDSMTIAERLIDLVGADLSQDYGTFSHIQLNSVVADAQAHGKTEGIA
jgi:hypothetical protein